MIKEPRWERRRNIQAKKSLEHTLEGSLDREFVRIESFSTPNRRARYQSLIMLALTVENIASFIKPLSYAGKAYYVEPFVKNERGLALAERIFNHLARTLDDLFFAEHQMTAGLVKSEISYLVELRHYNNLIDYLVITDYLITKFLKKQHVDVPDSVTFFINHYRKYYGWIGCCNPITHVQDWYC